MVNGLASNTEMDDNSNCDATVVLLKKGNCSSKSPCLLASFWMFTGLFARYAVWTASVLPARK